MHYIACKGNTKYKEKKEKLNSASKCEIGE
jgi:hypothetical protein